MLGTTTETQTQIFEFAGLPAVWARPVVVLAALGLLWLIFWFYRREGRVGAGAGLRLALAMVRSAVLIGLGVIALDPVIATYTQQTTRAAVVVLADASLSMSIAESLEDGESPRTRAARIGALMEEPGAEGWLGRLATRNELRVYSFGERVTPVPIGDRIGRRDADASPRTQSDAAEAAARDDALRPQQGATDLGQALTEVLSQLGDVPLAGVVLLTDGGLNRGLVGADLTALARRSRAPVYAVGVGAAQEPPNLRITSFSAPLTTPLGDPLELRIELAGEGVAAATTKLEVRVQRAGDDESSLVAERAVDVTGPHWTQVIPLRVPADSAGEFIFTARLAAIDEEAILADNARAATVLVVDERLRVLIVAGRPTPDYRFMTRLFERDRTIDLSCWLQSADARSLRDGDTVLSELPRRAEDLFQFDVVVLIDPDPRELDSSWAVAVRRLVDELGGGLIVQAGPHYTPQFLADERLAELVGILPVAPDSEAPVRLSALGAFRLAPRSMELPAEAAGHPLVQLGFDASETPQRWSVLPGVYWHYPVLREKPLASVLLRLADRTLANQFGTPVLMAVQPVGAGRVLFIGFDSLWRWRSTSEPLFNRFCVQSVRYLSQARRQGGSRRGTILVDRESPTAGEFIKVEARLLDESFAPWHEPRIAAQAVLGGGEALELPLDALPGREGWFGGRFRPETPGALTIRVPLPGGKDEFLLKPLQVQPPDQELRSLRQQVELLEALAVETDGAYVPIAEARRVPELIEDGTVVRPATAGPRSELWDRPWVLLVLAGLLSLEWTLRRRNHLL